MDNKIRSSRKDSADSYILMTGIHTCTYVCVCVSHVAHLKRKYAVIRPAVQNQSSKREKGELCYETMNDTG